MGVGRCSRAAYRLVGAAVSGLHPLFADIIERHSPVAAARQRTMARFTDPDLAQAWEILARKADRAPEDSDFASLLTQAAAAVEAADCAASRRAT